MISPRNFVDSSCHAEQYIDSPKGLKSRSSVLYTPFGLTVKRQTSEVTSRLSAPGDTEILMYMYYESVPTGYIGTVRGGCDVF